MRNPKEGTEMTPETIESRLFCVTLDSHHSTSELNVTPPTMGNATWTGENEETTEDSCICFPFCSV